MPAGIELLQWDSEFFGFRVGRVVGADNASSLEASLAAAAMADFELLYWPLGSVVAELDLSAHGYILGYGDRRVAYTCDLPAAQAQGLLDTTSPVEIAELPPGPAPDALLDLAPLAGAHSRFQRDSRIPNERFVALYRTWMSRSATRELADSVWVASKGSSPVGFVTGSVAEASGDIGLVAVSGGSRGDGVASALVASMGRWMLTRGATTSTVVTQQENLAACRLYEKAGFAVHSRSGIHHLWRVRGGR